MSTVDQVHGSPSAALSTGSSPRPLAPNWPGAGPRPPTTPAGRSSISWQSPSRNAELPVREVTGLNEGGEIPEARIVDRVEWIRAATQSMRVMTGGGHEAAKPRFVTGRITGAQTGAVLAFISSGILGQYDPFGPNGGELLLVYPNVIAVERQLRVLPSRFPAVGVPARGHPPGAVPRQPVAGRSHVAVARGAHRGRR